MKLHTFLTIVFASFLLSACGGGSTELSDTDVVESGTYTGNAVEVDPEEREIYVETAEGETLELYFTDQTKLTENGSPAEFNALSEGSRVEVQVEKKGQRLEPISVTILSGNG